MIALVFDLTQFQDRPIRLLVVKLSSLGDIIHATGVLRSLRQALPKAHISFAVESRWAAVLQHNSQIDRVIESTATTKLTLEYMAEIRRLVAQNGPFEIALDLQGNQRSAAWVYMTGAQFKLGRGGFRPCWKSAVMPDLSQHAVCVCAELCQNLGITVTNPDPEIFTSQADEQSLDRILILSDLPSNGYILLNPFSRWKSKNWPVENLIKVIKNLNLNQNTPLILTGGSEDEDQIHKLRDLLEEGLVHSLVGRLSLGEALCLFRRSKLMISCDSGPMHAAAAFGVPVLGLFGPTYPERTGPWGPQHRVLQALRPPSHHTYRTDAEGHYMSALSAENVLAEIAIMTEKKAP